MITGIYYDGASSQRIPAKLSLIGDNLVVTSEETPNDTLQEQHAEQVEISRRLGNLPRALRFNNDSVFECSNNDQIDALQQQIKPDLHGRWLNAFENRYSFVFIMLIVVVLFSWTGVKYGVPATAKAIAYALPVNIQQQAGDQSVSFLDEHFFSPSQLKPERQEQLQKTFTRLLRQTPHGKDIKVEFRNSEVIGANAFALPNNMIIFTDQIVDLSCNDNELVAILGHEIGHIEQRHLLRNTIQSSIIAIGAAFIIGDVSALGELFVALPAILLQSAYSREFEREADDYSLATLSLSQIPTGHFTSIMQRMSRQDDGHTSAQSNQKQETENSYEYFLSTHPQTEHRIKQFGPPIIEECPSKPREIEPIKKKATTEKNKSSE